ncbi:MAG: nuclear transport factor 2 family protein [Acidimicrobiales bacterium]
MTTSSLHSGRRSPSTPTDAVRAWWAAMQAGDLDALASLLADDYLVTGGPEGRLVGRSAVIEQTAQFSAEAAVDDWAISDLELRAGADPSAPTSGGRREPIAA